MQDATTIRRRGLTATKLAPSFLAVVHFFALIPFTRLDFDRHHDGYMVTVATALREGRNLHSEIASQYGPLTSWSQIPFTFLPFSTGLDLRLWTATALAATTFAIASLGLHAPPDWRINPRTSLTASLLWTLLNPTWLGLSLHPWSSVLVGLILACAMLALVSAYSSRGKRHDWSLLVSGFLIGVSPFARINAGSAAVTLICLGSLFLAFSYRELRRDFRLILYGLSSGIVVIVLVLLSQQSFVPYLGQSVIDVVPYLTDRTGPDSFNTFSGLFRVAREHVLTIGIIILAGVAYSANGKVIKSLATIAASFTFFRSIIRHLIDDVDQGTLSWIQSGGWDIHYRRFFVYFFLSAGVAIVFLALARSLLNRNLTRRALTLREQQERTVETFLLLLALALLVQIVPTWDIRHVWWAMPLLLVLSTTRLDDYSRRPFLRRHLLSLPALTLTLFVVFGVLDTLSRHRVIHPAGINSSGFLSDPWTAREIRMDSEFLEANLAPTSTFVPLVFNYDLVSLFGIYQGSDAFFVPGSRSSPQLEVRLSTAGFVLLDHEPGLYANDKSISDQVQNYPSSVLARSQRLVILELEHPRSKMESSR